MMNIMELSEYLQKAISFTVSSEMEYFHWKIMLDVYDCRKRILPMIGFSRPFI